MNSIQISDVSGESKGFDGLELGAEEKGGGMALASCCCGGGGGEWGIAFAVIGVVVETIAVGLMAGPPRPPSSNNQVSPPTTPSTTI